jgi:hypothetical protein
MCALQIPASAVLLLFKHDGSFQPSHVPGGIIPPHGGNGALHLCFAVPLASLDEWTAHLQEQSVELESRVRQTFGGVSLYFRDLDGHSVEVATPVYGSIIRPISSASGAGFEFDLYCTYDVGSE